MKCHGKDVIGKDCPNSVGVLDYMFGKAMCIDCQIALHRLQIKELKAKKRIRDFKTNRR